MSVTTNRSYPQTGSHNIVAGEHDEYTSYGGLVVAFESGLTAPFGVVFGAHNGTRAEYATVTGGEENTARGEAASVSGGREDVASGVGASVGGGVENTASGEVASVSGGALNNAASGAGWIGGGYKNELFFAKPGEEGISAAIFGGKEHRTAKNYEAIP